MKHDTATIHINKSNEFQTGGNDIRKYVEEYYNKILKLNNSKFRCYIYPLWMPRYRLFTSFELLRIMEESENSKYHGFLANQLPVFLSSYNNINMGAVLYCLEYIQESNSADEYLSNLKKYIINLNIPVDDNYWVSFIVSPIEIVTTKAFRVINEVTDWTCFSKIHNLLYADRDYTFLLSDHYFHTEKVRATSGDQNFFIHDSGKLAVEILAKTWNSYVQKADENLMQNVFNRSFCFWDISGCLDGEIEQLLEWCKDKNYSVAYLEEDPGIIAISHCFFSFGEFGAMLPGMDTWNKYDAIDFKSEEFVGEIPYGKLPEDNIYQNICEKYVNHYVHYNPESTNEVFTSYEQTSSGEAIRHDCRQIRFICYVHPIVDDFDKIFEKFIGEIENELNNTIININFEYAAYKEIDDIVLEIIPSYDMPTNEAINIVEPYFLKLIDNISPFIDNSHNMAYYIKYLLDRWLPEELVLK